MLLDISLFAVFHLLPSKPTTVNNLSNYILYIQSLVYFYSIFNKIVNCQTVQFFDGT